MDSIIVAVIMIILIISFITGAVIAHKKGNAGFAASVKYDERLQGKDPEEENSEQGEE